MLVVWGFFPARAAVVTYAGDAGGACQVLARNQLAVRMNCAPVLVEMRGTVEACSAQLARELADLVSGAMAIKVVCSREALSADVTESWLVLTAVNEEVLLKVSPPRERHLARLTSIHCFSGGQGVSKWVVRDFCLQLLCFTGREAITKVNYAASTAA